MKADFGGWATKAGIKCTDGRTIMPNAFQHMDGRKVPLVFQHVHNEIENVLGYAVLEHRDEGLYAHGYFNDTPKGKVAKTQVEHLDLSSLSIYANNLVEKSKQVIHGMVREVSLVLAGANPEAVIDFVRVAHSNDPEDFTDLEDEAVIHMALALDLDSTEEVEEVVPDTTVVVDDTTVVDDLQHAATDKTVEDVVNGMTEEEQNAVYYLINSAVEAATSATHSDGTTEGTLIHKEGADDMSRNVFDQDKKVTEGGQENILSHADVQGIFADAMKCGSLKEAAANFVDKLQHGIESIDVLFPDAKMATGTIELEKRRTEWVASVLNGTRHTPFARIKTFTADLTQDEARAKGYIKGNYKLEEWIGVTKRTTSPTTIYKKQKLDRDDMIDITDFDIVAFLKAEMRLMTEEEIARAILIGDGRTAGAEDKVKDPLGASDGIGIRSILNDHEVFVTTLNVNVDDANSSYEEIVDAVMDGMEFYKGTGTPALYTTIPQLNKFLKAKDGNQRRYYANRQEVADALGVSAIYTVEPMKEVPGLVGIIVNLDDYNVGTDRGGELTMFDDFDLDYNQQKYLLETRMSGALVKPKSALVIMKTAAANVLAVPTEPAFVASTGIITIPTVTGVVYKNAAGTTLTAGAQTALAAGASLVVNAVAAAGYYFANTAEDSWTFKRPAA